MRYPQESQGWTQCSTNFNKQSQEWCLEAFLTLTCKKEITTRWFKVTFSSPIWRSLNHLKGSLNHPKKVTKNCQVLSQFLGKSILLQHKKLASNCWCVRTCCNSLAARVTQDAKGQVVLSVLVSNTFWHVLWIWISSNYLHSCWPNQGPNAGNECKLPHAVTCFLYLWIPWARENGTRNPLSWLLRTHAQGPG